MDSLVDGLKICGQLLLVKFWEAACIFHWYAIIQVYTIGLKKSGDIGLLSLHTDKYGKVLTISTCWIKMMNGQATRVTENTNIKYNELVHINTQMTRHAPYSPEVDVYEGEFC